MRRSLGAPGCQAWPTWRGSYNVHDRNRWFARIRHADPGKNGRRDDPACPLPRPCRCRWGCLSKFSHFFHFFPRCQPLPALAAHWQRNFPTRCQRCQSAANWVCSKIKGLHIRLAALAAHWQPKGTNRSVRCQRCPPLRGGSGSGSEAPKEGKWQLKLRSL